MAEIIKRKYLARGTLYFIDRKEMKDIVKPIFFIGSGRCGSTLIFEIFANHPQLGWLPKYLEKIPYCPYATYLVRLYDRVISTDYAKGKYKYLLMKRIIRKLGIWPGEVWSVWKYYCGNKVVNNYLLNVKALEQEKEKARSFIEKVLHWEKKERFLAKITGPGRIGYLSSIFDDCIFIHIVRDGRAVAESFRNFWKDKPHRGTKPTWEGGDFNKKYKETWESYKRSPMVLAALEWKNIIETIREEKAALKPSQYLEIKYEDFVLDPRKCIDKICEISKIKNSEKLYRYIDQEIDLKNMNYKRFERFSEQEIYILNEILGDSLKELGYAV